VHKYTSFQLSIFIFSKCWSTAAAVLGSNFLQVRFDFVGRLVADTVCLTEVGAERRQLLGKGVSSSFVQVGQWQIQDGSEQSKCLRLRILLTVLSSAETRGINTCLFSYRFEA
jgi:hypothetical protein